MMISAILKSSDLEYLFLLNKNIIIKSQRRKNWKQLFELFICEQLIIPL